MNLSEFFDHWAIVDNPFRGEEARHDAVFAKMSTPPNADDGLITAYHSDFDKILGEVERPSTSVLFGEKGSGKTAIRMQIADRVRKHNKDRKTGRVFLVEYDDLNAQLDHLHERSGNKDPRQTLESIRLVDHIDAMLSLSVTRITNSLVGGTGRTDKSLGPSRDLQRAAKAMPKTLRREMLLLQCVFDRDEHAHDRTRSLARRLRLTAPSSVWLWRGLSIGGVVLPASVVGLYYTFGQGQSKELWLYGLFAAIGVWALMILKRLVWDRIMSKGLARRVLKQTRMLDRADASLARSLDFVPPMQRNAATLPINKSDEQRYAMLERLRRVLNKLGFSGMLVVIDRVDEPTLISGDADRMRAVIWPMFNNKFLQQDGLGIKMLLPIELRHALFKESNAFFQEARLDKQNLVERLAWTGAMLYDMCDTRLKACRKTGTEPISLLDLFDEDVSRQDIVDALDQMHQPRDAFKFLYRCLTEHCSNVTREQESWRIPRLVLDQMRKMESERVQQLYRGIRPA